MCLCIQYKLSNFKIDTLLEAAIFSNAVFHIKQSVLFGIHSFIKGFFGIEILLGALEKTRLYRLLEFKKSDRITYTLSEYICLVKLCPKN